MISGLLCQAYAAYLGLPSWRSSLASPRLLGWLGGGGGGGGGGEGGVLSEPEQQILGVRTLRIRFFDGSCDAGPLPAAAPHTSTRQTTRGRDLGAFDCLML